VQGQLAPGVPMPQGSAPSGAPIGADGRMPGLPPGVPLGPPAAGAAAQGGTAQMPASVGAPSKRVGALDVTRTAVPTRVTCEAQLSIARTDLRHSGGEFTIPVVLKPAACLPPISFSSTWIHIVDSTGFRFVADPNTSTTARDAMISIGAGNFFIRQEPPAQPGLAAAPGRLVFGLDKRGKTDTKRITGWTEYGTGVIAAHPGHPWLSVTSRPGKNKQQTYEVTVRDGSKLGPGRHDSYIDLVPEGSAPGLRIPVVVEVPGAY
jgi:hypothetical protein